MSVCVKDAVSVSLSPSLPPSLLTASALVHGPVYILSHGVVLGLERVHHVGREKAVVEDVV